jgi:hypothetical protein
MFFFRRFFLLAVDYLKIQNSFIFLHLNYTAIALSDNAHSSYKSVQCKEKMKFFSNQFEESSVEI